MTSNTSSDSQLSLALIYEQKPEILKKPVQAIHMAITGGIQSKTQRLAFNAMLKHALEEEQSKAPGVDISTYSMSRTELMRVIGYTSPNRRHLKEALQGMQKLTVEWDLLKQDGEGIWASCVLLPFVGFDRDRIYYSYAPQVKPLLLDAKIYAHLDLRIQRIFSLDPSAALYEWVNRFRTNPSRLTNEMPWEDWRWVIYGEVSETSVLNTYKLFKRTKLKPAIDEINARSDLTIELIEKKDGGRSVRYLQFEVREKELFRVENEPSKEEREEWDKRLEDFGVSARDRRKIFATYSIKAIEAHWKLTVDRVNDKSQPVIKRPAMYLKRALEGQYAADKVQAQEVTPPQLGFGAMSDIEAAFTQSRNDEAEAMFAEMLEGDREAAISEYNAMQTIEIARIPPPTAKRLARHMIPFYAWLAAKHWGQPTAQEILEFAVKSGAVSLTPPPK